MLTSLFGEFGPRRLRTEPASGAPVATPVVDSDVVIAADAAHAMRAHFAATRSDLDHAGSMITLMDPTGIWAPQVIRALSDASGQRVERLNLRETGTLRTLAVIERTSVPRMAAGSLKVYHAETRSSIVDGNLAGVLAERSHLTAVILGGMPPHAVTGLLRDLLAATRQPEWNCPWLVFIVPPGAGALRRRILEQDWPANVHTAAMSESLSGPASVWNAVLTAWEAAASSSSQPRSASSTLRTLAASDDGSVQAPQWLARVLAAVSTAEGLLACGMVDLDSGDLLATEGDAGLRQGLRQQAAALCAARRAHLAAGGPEIAAPEEILVSMGMRQALLRRLTQSDSLGFVALVDRARANLSLLRFRLNEAERQLD